MKLMQRHEARNLCADLVLVGWKGANWSEHREWATLEDISSSGACIKVEDRISPGTPVTLRFSTSSCDARVRYCVGDHTGYLLGVKFENGYRWSRKLFRPEHLIQFHLQAAPKSKTR